jgi:AraC-like DNA-binding protein
MDASARFTELQTIWADRQPGYITQARAVVTTIVHRIIAAHSAPQLRSPHARRIAKVLEMILANWQETYSVNDLADVAGLSPSHFRVMFKQMTGHTVTAYQQRVKIEKATELLLSGEYNVTQTAMRTGFRDVYYFSRLYKKVTGRNPSDLART